MTTETAKPQAVSGKEYQLLINGQPTPARNRAAVLRKAADKIRQESAELARLLASEVGKPLGEASMEVTMTADVFDYYAGLALDIKGQVISNYASDAVGID